MSQPLRGDIAPNLKREEDRIAVGGLRDATSSVTRLPSVAAFGADLGKQIAGLLESNPDWVPSTCSCIGHEDRTPPAEAIAAVRGAIATACNPTDVEPIFNASCSTDIRGGLLEAWRAAANDPDDQVGPWLHTGAPAGIREHAPHCGIFPAAATDVELDPEGLETDFNSFEN